MEVIMTVGEIPGEILITGQDGQVPSVTTGETPGIMDGVWVLALETITILITHGGTHTMDIRPGDPIRITEEDGATPWLLNPVTDIQLHMENGAHEVAS